jgi:hypothetical protein
MLKTSKPAAAFSINMPGDIGVHGVHCIIPLDLRPVFEMFASFPTGTEGGGQYHAAAHAPAPETQTQPLHLLINERFLDRHQRPPVRTPPAISRAWRSVSSLRMIPCVRPTWGHDIKWVLGRFW